MVASIWFNGKTKNKLTNAIVKAATVDTCELEFSNRSEDDETDFTTGNDLPRKSLTNDDVDTAYEEAVKEPYINHYLPVTHGMDLKKFRTLRDKVFEATSKEENEVMVPRSEFMQRAKIVKSEPCIQYIDIPNIPSASRKSFIRSSSEKSRIRHHNASPYIAFEKADSTSNIKTKNGNRILRWVTQSFLPLLMHSERLKRKEKPNKEFTQQSTDPTLENEPVSATIVDLDEAFDDHFGEVENERSKLSTEDDVDEDQFDSNDLPANRLNSLISKILADDLSVHKMERIRKIQHFHRPESDCDDFSYTNTTVNDSVSGRFSTGLPSLCASNYQIEGRYEDDLSTVSGSFGGGNLLRNYQPIVLKYRHHDTKIKSTRIIL